MSKAYTTGRIGIETLTDSELKYWEKKGVKYRPILEYRRREFCFTEYLRLQSQIQSVIQKPLVSNLKKLKSKSLQFKICLTD